MSLLKAPGGGFAINAAGFFAWGTKRDPLRNREMGGAQALGGCQSLKKQNNQPKDSVCSGGGCLRRDANKGNGNKGGK
jgi:hypothetical protein